MEKGTRVQEIKKRFEGLTSQNNDSSSAYKNISTNCEELDSKAVRRSSESESQTSVKGIIKRSHAFRSDKAKVKPSNTNVHFVDDCFIDNKKPPKFVKPSELSLQSRIKATNQNIPVKSSTSRVSHSNISSQKLTDTLKKALNNPLPIGPAPKKPPRTFAHSGKSLENSETHGNGTKQLVTNKLSDPIPIKSNENSVPLNKHVALSRRSKTEPHIMLKKLESALLSNQLKNIHFGTVPKPLATLPPTKQISTRNLSSHLKPSNSQTLCLNGFGSCLNKNIYDTPFEPKSTFFVDDKGRNSPQISLNNNTYGSVKKLVRPHIYEEPYSPRTERKLFQQKSEPNLETASLRPSVHYMSTPINSKRLEIQKQLVSADFKSNCGKKDEIKMITDAFNDNTKSDSDADSLKDGRSGLPESHEEITAVRKVYAQRVSSMRQQTPRSPREGHHLFESLLIIGIDEDVKLGKIPYIKSKYPESTLVPERIAELVFPDAEDWPPSPYRGSVSPPSLVQHNNYILTLTSNDGSRKYAYCRRLQPEGAPVCIPLAYLIITPIKENHFYYSILSELESCHGLPETQSIQLVRRLYESKIPKPGSSLQLGEVTIRRPVDTRQEGQEITALLQALSVPVFIKVFSTLLIERKVILVGSNISLISDCIEGLQKCLFPFEWEHTVIGAVPSSLLELCTAPTPFLMGVLRPKHTNTSSSQSASFLPLTSIDNCVVVDVDRGEILECCGDESSLLPSRLSSCLRSALYLCPVHGTDVGPSEAILRLFVELVGHYNSHVITDVHTNSRMFQREAFIKEPRSRSIQLFLDWFTETAMFQSFIQRRLDRSFVHGIFEQRCAEYIQENVKNHITKKDKTFNKTVKIIDRFKDWTSSS